MTSTLLQITASMFVFCVFYHLALKRLTFFSFNRWYLLGTLILSIVIPFTHIEIKEVQQLNNLNTVLVNSFEGGREEANDLKATGNALLEKIETKTIPALAEAGSIVVWAYAIISFFFLIRFLLIMSLLIHKSIYAQKRDGVKIIKSFWRFSNCSFFSLLIINSDNLKAAELKQIIAHEQEHVSRFHSIDKVLVELIRIAMWFNPLLYYYKNAINQVHEFEVDHAIGKSFDKKAYSNLLLRISGFSSQPLVNSFSKNPLKTRIQMLFTKQSKEMKKLVYLLFLPLICGIIWLFSVEIVYALPKADKASSPKSMEVPANNKSIFRKKSMQILEEQLNKMEQVDLAINKEFKNIASFTPTNILSEQDSSSFETAKSKESLNEEKPGKFRIVLDPGHGGKDNAAQIGGIYEKNLVLEISKEIKQVLEEKGYEVVMTRETDVFVPLRDRASVKGDIFVSVHVNTAPSNRPSSNGMDIYVSKYMKADSTSTSRTYVKAGPDLSTSRDRLAMAFKNELTKLDGIRMNQLKESNLNVLQNNTAPAILVELGYITYERDLKFITDRENQKKIANAFAEAIQVYQKL